MRAPSPTIEAAADPAVAALEARLAGCPWRLLHSGPAPGAWNMALDEALLHAAAREDTPPTLRLYGWDPPCVSLGHFQETGGVRLEYARERGWDVVRRPTGGRGVLHHREVTYSLVLPPSVVGGAGVRTSYCALTRALNAGLRLLLGTGSPAPAGPPAAADGAARRPREANCFALAGEGDTVLSGGKLVGSAQVRREGALLQHGSILLDAHPEDWAALFGTSGRLLTLRQLLGRTPEFAEVAQAVAAGFQGLGVALEDTNLTQAERETARLLLLPSEVADHVF